MFISIQELELHEIVFKEEFQPGAIDFGQDIRQRRPLSASGRAELVEEHRGKNDIVRDIRFIGRFDVGMELKCARCLEPVAADLHDDFDLLYRPLGVDQRKDEVSISVAETEIGFYSGEGILLEEVVKEQVFLSVPVKVVCHSECRGLCPQCGKNMNYEACNCEQSYGDPRWAALADIKKNLKN